MTAVTAVDVNIKTVPDRIAELVLILFALFANKIKGCVNSHSSLLHSLDYTHYLLDPAEVVDEQRN